MPMHLSVTTLSKLQEGLLKGYHIVLHVLLTILKERVHACSIVEDELQKEKVDRWCADVAKSGLQERVVAQAAALVELEGLTERLSLQCSDKAQTVQVGI